MVRRFFDKVFSFLLVLSILCVGLEVWGTRDKSVFRPITSFKEYLTNNSSISQKTGKLNGPYKVVRVVDGDTIIVNISGKDIRVRFIGIDTPESVNLDKSKNSQAGKVASEFTKKHLKNKTVYLEYDESRYDKYGRTLAYVYISDKVMFNRVLLENGLAKTMFVKPNTKYKSDFENIEREAQNNRVGIWKENSAYKSNYSLVA